MKPIPHVAFNYGAIIHVRRHRHYNIGIIRDKLKKRREIRGGESRKIRVPGRLRDTIWCDHVADNGGIAGGARSVAGAVVANIGGVVLEAGRADYAF